LSSTSTPEQKNDYVDRWGMPQPLIVFTSKPMPQVLIEQTHDGKKESYIHVGVTTKLPRGAMIG